MTEEVEVDEPDAAAAGQHRVHPHVPVGPPSTPNKQNTVAVQATRTCGIEVSRKRGKGREVGTILSPHKLEESASCNEGESQWNGSDSIDGFWLLLIRCEWNVMLTLSTEAYHNSDSRQEVPSKPWFWQHNFNSYQQKSLKDECASGKQQAIGI